MSLEISRRTVLSLPAFAALSRIANAEERKGREGAEILKTDVLVVGSGFSGLSAAVAATREGAKVILIEKRNRHGGDGVLSAGVFQTYRTPMHDAQGITKNVAAEDYWRRFQEGLDDEPLAKVRDNTPESPIYHGFIKHNPEVMKRAAMMAPEVIAFTQEFGAEYMPLNKAMPYRVPMRAGNTEKFAQGMLKELKEKNVTILKNTRALKLITDKGSVVGVEAEGKGGKPIDIYAKAVILATGGFINNEYLKKRYKGFWSDLPTALRAVGEPTAKDRTGDGIMMGKEIGAALEDMESMPKFSAYPEFGNGRLSWMSVDVEPVYVLTPSGRRVTDENKARYSGICLALINKKLKTAYTLFGQDTVEGRNKERFGMDKVIQSKGVYKGNTPEELAAASGMDPKVLKETIERINRDAAAGKDTEFGRTDPFFKPLRPPYYLAGPMHVAIYKTEGGLEVNPNFQVIRADDDKPIPGLYAAGAGCGSITSRHSEVVASGLIAGREAAKASKENK